jgi:hypothetical protein
MLCAIAAIAGVIFGRGQAGDQSQPQPPLSGSTADENQGGLASDSGYVFVDGQFVSRPYSLRVDAGRLLIGERVVEKAGKARTLYRGTGDIPPLPDGITAETSMYDKWQGESMIAHIQKRAIWIRQHKPEDQARREILEMFRALPFFESADLPADGGDFVEVVRRKDGSKFLVTFSAPPPDSDVTETQVTEVLRSRKESFERGLVRGQCYFVWSDGGGLTLPTGEAQRQLPALLAIALADQPMPAKVGRVRGEGLLLDTVPDAMVIQLLKEFASNPELRKCIENDARAN